MAQMRTSHPDETQLMLLAFDLLHRESVDMRGLPLSERKRYSSLHCAMTPTEPHFIYCVAVLRASH